MREARQILLLPLLASLLAAQSSAPPEKFDVASIKLVPPERRDCPANPSHCFRMTPWGGATFTAQTISLSVLVEMAYGVTDKQITNIDKLGTELYDVSAKPEKGALVFERSQPMLRALLEERFNLAAHRETKDVQGYVLTVAKGGAKLKPADAAPGQTMTLRGRLIAPDAPMAVFKSMLEGPLGKPVVDKTDLPGAYSIDFKFAPEGDAASTQPSIFTAIQEQLGLKLEAQKVPFETLVIDRCNPIPTQN